MYQLISTANWVLSTLVFLLGIAIIGTLLLLALRKLTKKPLGQRYLDIVQTHGLTFALIIALTSVLGSLFYSEVAEFAPCKLCWFQRIFKYPLLFILTMAVAAKDRRVVRYVLPLSLTGLCISMYHYTVQLINTFGEVPEALAPSCSTVGMTPSCVDYFFMHYGYITLPMMCLTGFAGISLLVWLAREKK
jgi:disulfide bond formation protein DsbB